jgi:hypothetical protein
MGRKKRSTTAQGVTLKRILLPAGGALLATGLLAAGLAGTAQADPDIDSATLAADTKTAQETVNYWLASNGEAMKKATSYYYDDKNVSKVVEKGGYVADSKPSLVEPIGGGKTVTTKSHNVNFPKTIGKVFFQGNDGNSYWCSATSIQGSYKNLVATAGSCVYDLKGNDDVMDKWVFVPMYYDGKTPQGIYVGKQAFTHYDFSNYEDRDRDYAFVTVYNGVNFKKDSGSKKEVLKSEFDAYQGNKWVEKKDITSTEYDAGVSKHGKDGPYRKESVASSPQTVAKPADVDTEAETAPYRTADGEKGVKLTQVEVTEKVYTDAPVGFDNNAQDGSKTTNISQETYRQLDADKKDGKFLGKLEVAKDANGNEISWKKTEYFVKKWVASSSKEIYWVETYFIGNKAGVSLVDVGRLGDNVGGQGVAFSQKTGQTVRTFGYPYAKHPDGSKPFTGVTPKWCYGKTGTNATKVPALKIEEHVSLKCTVTGGYNGGPWLMKYSNAKRMGYVNGVTSVLYDDDKNERWDHISSPYFDGETGAVYKAASAAASGKYLPGS